MDRRVIVVGTDFSEIADRAVEAAVALARRDGGRLVLMHVMDDTVPMVVPYSYTDEQIANVAERARGIAVRKLAAIDIGGDIEVERIVRNGRAARSIAQEADDIGASLIVVGTHGYGAVRRTVWGSVASALIRIADLPVLIVGEHTKATMPPKKVIAAIDLSPVSQRVLESAVRMMAPGGQLTVLSFYEPPYVAYAGDIGVPPMSMAVEMAARAKEHEAAVGELVRTVATSGLEVKVVVRGSLGPSHAILEELEEDDTDLCVLGTSGHSAWSRFILGSTATRVIANAPTPVLVVPYDVAG